MFKQIPETTFGSTPAAKQLVRKLNESKDSSILRSVGKQISVTSKQVSELIDGYYSDSISAKTLANMLRLLRKEISDTSDGGYLLDQLRKNVQIGYIKHGLRIASVARKGETFMKHVNHKVPTTTVQSLLNYTANQYVMNVDGVNYYVGSVYKFGDKTPDAVVINKIEIDRNDKIVALNAKSDYKFI